jgi:hypothetical protein
MQPRQAADIGGVKVYQARGEVGSNLGSHCNDGPVHRLTRDLDEPILVVQYCGPPSGGPLQLGGGAAVGSVEFGKPSLGVSHGVTKRH